MAVNQWDKGSSYNGPNAHKKGNRTKSKRNADTITESTKRISDDISRYKEIAEKVRRSRKYRQEDLWNIYQGLKAYIDRQSKEDRPITVSGMILASGISSGTWYEMLNGDYDYRLYEYIEMYNTDIDAPTGTIDNIPYAEDENGRILLIPYSTLLQKAMLLQQEQTEERLYSKGRVGDIFALKAMHGWQEETSPHTVNQTLVLASPEQAKEAIKMLE